jgi:hydroxypyruvate isomerase
MIPTGLAFAVNTSMLFTELPLLDRPAAAAASGFAAVESWWPFAEAAPDDKEVNAFVDALQEAGVSLAALNLFAGDRARGERGIVSIPGREQELRDSLRVLVTIAERTGCRAFNAPYGQRVGGIDPRTQDDLAVRNLAFIAKVIGEIGGTVLVEPLTAGENGAYPLLTADDVLKVIDRVTQGGPGNVRLLADVYHLARNEDDPAWVLIQHMDRIGHVQVADVPGRNEPGTGILNFGELFTILAVRGYAGYVGLEYQPTSTSIESFGWLPSRYRSQRLTKAGLRGSS